MRSPLGNTVKGQIIRGAVEGKEQLFYKDVYLDIYQLIEIVASLPQVDEEQLASYGASQGGALEMCIRDRPKGESLSSAAPSTTRTTLRVSQLFSVR